MEPECVNLQSPDTQNEKWCIGTMKITASSHSAASLPYKLTSQLSVEKSQLTHPVRRSMFRHIVGPTEIFLSRTSTPALKDLPFACGGEDLPRGPR